MTNVIDLRPMIVERLNSLPPHSRKRDGYCDMLRWLNTMEMQEAKLSADLAGELDRVFGADLGRLREVW